ncbi:MAG: 2-oxo acid dehydrogenase subunit E2 [Actinobacteria bacterium]|nr:2-oxo acid dehydrogenase subunit E2 [Actinomycetota bacterium]
MAEFRLPDLGEGLTEAEIVAWRVAVGDEVSVDQPIVDVETAKAVVEVPAPFAGLVAELHGRPGDTIAVGAPLITIAAPESGSGRVLVGYGTAPSVRRRHRAAGASANSLEAAAPAASTASSSAGPRVAQHRPAVVSPLVRRMIRAAGLDAAGIHGSGQDGLITRRDADRAIKASTDPTPTVTSQASRIPLRGPRKRAAEKLSRSRREIPEATVWVDVDATPLVALRSALNEQTPSVSLLALMTKFTTLGLRRFPELNARVEDDAIVLEPAVHLGFAASTERGLVVPVIRDAQDKTLEQLATALSDSTERARSGRLTPTDLTGGTFTLNNYGVFGVDGSAAIINFPEVAILGVGRIVQRPWVIDGAVVPRSVTQLTLSFDHRACDGATAGGFLRFIADCVESPATAWREAR